jgi:UDP-glucuronate 4-epimerase
MAFSRFLALALCDRPLTIHGDGWQVREFTYFADVVQATLAAAEHGERGSVYNVGGGQPVALLDAIALIESLLDREIAVGHGDAANGDPRRTEADVTRAARDLAYRPATPLADGLAAQVDAVRGRVQTADLVA